MKKIISLFVLFSMALTFFHSQVQAAEAPAVSAKSYVLLEAQSGEILAQGAADTQMLIASTTKILTGALVLERLDPEALVEIQQAYTGIEGSSMYLRPGETLTVGDLVYGLMLASGNDAAVALAYHTAGGIEEFSALMNEKARELGMTQSHFVNPHGLDAEGHFATARDMAILTAWAMEIEPFAQVVGTRSIQAAGRSLVNHNKLLWRYPAATGVKTGFTKSAGRSLVSSAEEEGTRLICVTLSAPDDWNDHQALLDWGFAHYQYHQIVSQGEEVARVPLISGQREDVALVAEMDMGFLAGTEDEIEVILEVPRFAYAAVEAGAKGGRISVAVNGEVLHEGNLVYGESVAQDEAIRLGFWEQVRWHWEMAHRQP